MTTYLVRRLVQTVIFIFLGALALYTVLVVVMPDGPATRYRNVLAGTDTIYPPVDRVFLEHAYKLDRPWPVNFLALLFDPTLTTRYVWTGGDFGKAITVEDTHEPIGIDVTVGPVQLKGSGLLTGQFGEASLSDMFGDRWANTARLLGAALLICVLVGVPIGIIGAVWQHRPVDHIITLGVFSGLSVPPFVLGLLLIIFLSLLPAELHFYSNWTWMPYLPIAGAEDIYTTSTGFNLVYHLVLPALTLAIPQIALISRHVRFSLLEVLRQDYIRTAWNKGLPRRHVVLKHALKNATVPIIVAISQSMTGLVSTAIVVESLFAYPGVAKMLYRSLGGCAITQSMLVGRDPPTCPPNAFLPMNVPVALTLLLVLLIVISVFTMLADVLNGVTDPRISQKSS